MVCGSGILSLLVLLQGSVVHAQKQPSTQDPNVIIAPDHETLTPACAALVREIDSVSLGAADQKASMWQRVRSFEKQVKGTEQDLLAAILYERLGFRVGTSKDIQEAYQLAREAYRRVGKLRFAARAIRNAGLALVRIGELDDGLESFLLAETLYRELDDQGGQAHCLYLRGEVHYSFRRFELSIQAYSDAEGIFRKVRNFARAEKAASSRGAALSMLFRWEEALAAYDEALTLASRVGNRSVIALAMYNRAQILMDMGRRDEARDALDQVEVLFRKMRDRTSLARVSLTRGILFFLEERYEEALSFLAEAEDRAEVVKDPFLRAMASFQRGQVYFKIHRLEDALTSFDAAEASFRIHDPIRLTSLLASRAASYCGLSRWDEALRGFSEAEVLCRQLGQAEQLNATLCNRAYTLSRLSRLEEALAEISRVEAMMQKAGDALGETRCMNVRAGILKQLEKNQEALELYTEVIDRFQGNEESEAQAGAYLDRGFLLADQSKHRDALDDFLMAAAHVRNRLSRSLPTVGESAQNLRESWINAPVGILSSLEKLEQKKPEDIASAYRVIQTFHAFGMAQLLCGSNAGLEYVPEDLIPEYDEIVSRAGKTERDLGALERKPDRHLSLADLGEISNVRRRLESEERELDLLVETVRLRSRAFSLIRPQPTTPEEVQKVLAEDAALLEYFVSEKVYAFVITRSSVDFVPLGEWSGLKEETQRLLAQIQSTPKRGKVGSLGRPETRDSLRRLAERLLDPVLDRLSANKKIRTLLIAPDMELSRIPFDALLLPPDQSDQPARFLVEEYSISYVHSGTVFRQMASEPSRQRDQHRFVAFGDPAIPDLHRLSTLATAHYELNRDAFAPLPHAAMEVLEVSELFAANDEERAELRKHLPSESRTEPLSLEIQGARFCVFLGEDASEENLKNRPEVREATVLHFAVHGRSDLSPTLSCLVLSQADREEAEEDGFVRIRDVSNLDLNVDLMVLSSCESNQGPLQTFEGVLGLSRAALAGGARSVISTLWRIQDQASRKLIVSFYRAWLEGGMSRIDALSHAKRMAIRDGLPLGTWSAFVLWDATGE